jgi:two-component system, NarL family, sensor histidine kinase DesK
MQWLFNDDDGVAGSPRRRRTIGLSVGLIYLLPLIKVIAGYSGIKLLLGTAGLVAVVASYLGSALIRRDWNDPILWSTWTLLGVFSALVVVLPFAFGNEWIGLPVYTAVVYAITLPHRWAVWGVVASAAVVFAQSAVLGASAGAVLSVTITALSIGMMMLAFRRARTLVRELREARGEVARLAATEERLRIARDLHDLLGHSLSLIVLKSELAGRIAGQDPERIGREVKDIESVARQALADVREAVSGYRRRTLTDELDSARTVLSAAGVDTTVRTSGTPLPDQLDGLFGWAVREAVTNVVRHARATSCELTVSRDRKGAVLRVCDDGVTVGTGAGPDTDSYVPGNGITGLTERIAAAGGTVEAGPVHGGGFLLTVRLPLVAPVRPESIR